MVYISVFQVLILHNILKICLILHDFSSICAIGDINYG